MRYLILSDIHANLPAFQAVINDAPVCDKIIFLGDIANFGPNPCECVDLLRELGAVCIMGNHDEIIAHNARNANPWDCWAAELLSESQKKWMQQFAPSIQVDASFFALHGIYTVDYDILPNTPDSKIEFAFSDHLPTDASAILFGHYHYQIDRFINGVSYHCVRPVGHHRDHDIRASYSVFENGKLTNYRVEYDIERTLYDTKRLVNCYDIGFMNLWLEFVRNAYSEFLLRKDIIQMQKNEEAALNGC